MLSGRVDRLRRRLNSPVPLLGSYLRRRALNALVADGSAGAAGAVAQAVVLSGAGSDWQRQLLAALDRVHDPDWHDATCAVWAESRHPPLAGLLLRRGRIATSPPWLRVLTALKLRQRSALAPLSVEGVHALLDATQDAESEVAGEAWAALREVRDPPALDVIAERWAETRAPGYLEPLALARPPRPRWPWLLVALKLGRVELAARVGPDEVRLLLEACGDADAEIAAHARAALGQLTDPAARDALIQRVLEADDPLARDVALSAGYVPLEPERQALSLFLTGQWSAYEQLDFEHALLRAAYERASPELRARIGETARREGRAEFVAITTGRGSRRSAGLSAKEWEVTLAVLERRADWGQLWALARTAPPCWSAEILRRLGRAGWAPAGPDRADYDSLRQRSSGWDDLALGPPGYCWARLCGHSAPVECLAVSPDGRLLASGDREGRARLWALPGGELLRELPSLPGPVHCLLFGPDGRTLFAGGASAVHYWRLPRGHAGRPFHGCTGPVTALALTPDGKTLVSLSADFAQVWDLTEEEPEGKPLEHGGRLTCLAISPDGEVLATGNTAGDVWLSWHLPDGELKDQLTGHLGPVTGVAFSADGKTVAGAGPAGLLLYDVSSRAARAGPSRHTAPLAAPGFEPDPRALLGRRRAQWAALWPMPDGRALAARCHGRDIRLWTTSRSKNGTTNHTNNTNRRLRCVLAPLREALLFCHSEG